MNAVCNMTKFESNRKNHEWVCSVFLILCFLHYHSEGNSFQSSVVRSVDVLNADGMQEPHYSIAVCCAADLWIFSLGLCQVSTNLYEYQLIVRHVSVLNFRGRKRD